VLCFALRDDMMTRCADVGCSQQLGHVFEAYFGAIDRILVSAIAKDRTFDDHFIKVYIQKALGVVERRLDRRTVAPRHIGRSAPYQVLATLTA